MRLRTTMSLAVGAALAMLVAAVYLSGQAVLRIGLMEIERGHADEAGKRLRMALDGELGHLSGKITDWAYWDDAWHYLIKPDPEFLRVNVPTTLFAAMHLDVVVFADVTGAVIAVRTPGGIPPPPELGGAARLGIPLPAPGSPRRGMLRLADGRVALFAAAAVVPSDGLGESHGSILFARIVDQTLVTHLAALTDLALTQVPVEFARKDCEFLDDAHLAGVVTSDGIDGRPALSLRFVTDRMVAAEGRRLLGIFALGLAAMAAAGALIILVMIDRLVVRRVARLGHELTRIADAADVSQRVSVHGHDELADLAHGINATLAALAQAQVEIVEGAATLDALTRAIPDRMLFVTADGVCESVRVGGSNDSTGMTLSGRPLVRMPPEEIVARAKPLVMAALANQRPVPLEFAENDGSHHELSVLPCDRRRVLVVVRDITARRQVEERLRLATARAEAANEAKSVFLATMSHELRTPLHGILGMAELLRPSLVLGQEPHRLDVLIASAESLLLLINDLLDLSKIEAERMVLERAPIQPATIVEQVLDLLAPRAQQRGLGLAFIPGEHLPSTVVGDGLRLRQVLTNLVGNALKFTVAGEVSVWLDGEREGAGWRLRCAVSDTGPGLTPEVQARIFAPFVQGDESIARQHGGSGLGLVITRRLVELMGGTIAVHSQPGRGSMFNFTLLVEGGEETETPPRPQGRVLVAAHSCALRAGTAAWLRRAGWEAEECATAADMAAAMNVTPPRLVVAEGVLLEALAADLPCPAVRLGTGGVTLPLHAAHLLEACNSALTGARWHRSQAEPTSAAVPDWSDRRVLVVDDQVVNRLVACGMLERIGVTAEAVDGGEAALARLAAGGIDLVLMDVQMPVMDGYAATIAIRALPGAAAQLPVIAMTASAQGADLARSRAAGMVAHLAKPVRPAELAACLARFLRPSAPLPTAADTAFATLCAEVGEDLARAALAAFAADAPSLMDDCAEACARGDYSTAARKAHALKGDAANLRMAAAAAVALRLENACRANSPDAVNVLGELRQALNASVPA